MDRLYQGKMRKIMNMTSFKEIGEIALKKFADSPLGRMSESKVFDKPMSDYDKPLRLHVAKKDDSLLRKPEGLLNEFRNMNTELANKKHPETGVLFVKKTVIDSNGNKIEGVFPVFESQFDVYLPENLYMETDAKQFKECNRQLKEAVEKDPEFAKKFTPEQLEQIKNGDTPDGYVWHHNEETGKMQLVDAETHAKTAHTGGKAIWGGGQEKR
jgi:hypothetical protein